MLEPSFPIPGDIALVTGGAKSSKLIAASHRLLRKRTRFSHCAINFFGDIWCHASPPGGVQLITTSDLLLGSNYESDWEVLRPITAPKDDQSPGAIRLQPSEHKQENPWLDATLYFCGQRYNYIFMLPKIARWNHSKFCSELVAEVYERVGHTTSLKEKRATSVTPAHLDELATKTAEWRPVTTKIKEWFDLNRRIPGALERRLAEEQMTLRSVEAIFLRGRKDVVMSSVSQAKRTLEVDKLLHDRMLRLHELTPSSKPPVLPDRRLLLDETEKQLIQLRATYWDVVEFANEGLSWIAKQRKNLGYVVTPARVDA